MQLSNQITEGDCNDANAACNAHAFKASPQRTIVICHDERFVSEYKVICTACIPGINTGQMIDSASCVNAMILSNGSRQVLGGVTYRFVIVAPSMIVLQVQILAVHFDHQHVGLGKTLVYFLHNAIANKLAARSDKSTCACSGCIHVQADNGAVGFWSKMGFAANHLAEDLCSALHTWHPDQYPVYHGASAMIAKVLSSREIPAFAAASFSPLDTCSATTRTRDHVRRKKQPVSRFIAGPVRSLPCFCAWLPTSS